MSYIYNIYLTGYGWLTIKTKNTWNSNKYEVSVLLTREAKRADGSSFDFTEEFPTAVVTKDYTSIDHYYLHKSYMIEFTTLEYRAPVDRTDGKLKTTVEGLKDILEYTFKDYGYKDNNYEPDLSTGRTYGKIEIDSIWQEEREDRPPQTPKTLVW